MLLVNTLISVCLISTQHIAKPFVQGVGTLSSTRATYNVPPLTWECKEVNQAINSKRLLLLLDYHGTMMGYEKQDHPKLKRILTEISQTSDLVITSGGTTKELLEHLDGIPHLTIAAEIAPAGTQEQAKRIKQIYEYLEDGQLTSSPDREYSHWIAIGEKVDPNFVSLFYETLKQKFKDEELTAWRIMLPRNKRYLQIDLANQDKTKLAEILMKNAMAEGEEFDYVIGMGDSDLDETLLEYLNQHHFLSIMVENAFHKKLGTTAQFRLPNADAAQDLLQHIANQRIKRIESHTSGFEY
ncbi:hypothetical protein DFH28DRAFT_1196603 [Melampsora americana]|nr:hypothetical protein DFH28DRAFT_1196603 [Melampsora americana]